LFDRKFQLGKELRALLTVAGPLIINNLAIAGINFSDAVMAGRLGASQLAAVSVGGSVWLLAFVFCLGLLMALSPIVSRLVGAGDLSRVGRYVRQGFWLSQVLGITIFLLAQWLIAPLLAYIGIDSAFREDAVGYIQAIMFGIPAMCAFLVFRFTTEGLGVTRPIMWSTLFSLVSNIFGNWVLMYGNLGAPALGATGCGISSAITIWLMAIGLGVYLYSHKQYKPLKIFVRSIRLRWKLLRELLSLGLPITMTITAEAGLFSAVSILVGTISAQVSAAHQIAVNFAGTMFMIPLAFSSATTVRVGHALGADDSEAARFRGWLGIICCGAFMLGSATFMLFARDLVVGLYTSDPSVKEIAMSLLLVAAVFQVSDGVQIGSAAALRGYKDTRVPMMINLVAYWVIAFPLAYYAAVIAKAEPQFIWMAFVAGLFLAASLLTYRYGRISKMSGLSEGRDIP
jgi:MATE family multidrug resistance protein